jgi:hypothetical protein
MAAQRPVEWRIGNTIRGWSATMFQ